MNGIPNKYSAELDVVGQFADRYMGCGYNREYSIPEMFDRLSEVKRITGVELVSNWHITQDTAGYIKQQADDHGLQVVSILPDHFSQRKWGKGAFTSTDPAIRREAIELTKSMMDVAVDLGSDLLTIWNGQDGYDYPLTANYIQELEWLKEGLAECCNHRSDVRLAIEYKIREPRIRCYLSNVYATLMMIKEVNKDNLGVTVDFGHCLIAHENPAEAIAACKAYGDRLFHVHVNDNFGVWDDDCMTSTEHIVETLEFMYWLKRTGYDGWYSFDQFTPRLDGKDALIEGANWLDDVTALAEKLDDKVMDDLFTRVDAVEMSKMLRELLFHR